MNDKKLWEITKKHELRCRAILQVASKRDYAKYFVLFATAEEVKKYYNKNYLLRG